MVRSQAFLPSTPTPSRGALLEEVQGTPPPNFGLGGLKKYVSEKVGTVGELYEGKITTKMGYITVDSILPRVLKIAILRLKIAHPSPLYPYHPHTMEMGNILLPFARFHHSQSFLAVNIGSCHQFS